MCHMGSRFYLIDRRHAFRLSSMIKRTKEVESCIRLKHGKYPTTSAELQGKTADFIRSHGQFSISADLSYISRDNEIIILFSSS